MLKQTRWDPDQDTESFFNLLKSGRSWEAKKYKRLKDDLDVLAKQRVDSRRKCTQLNPCATNMDYYIAGEAEGKTTVLISLDYMYHVSMVKEFAWCSILAKKQSQ